MTTITLRKAANSWQATFDGPETPQIIDLFGTATIPTGFTPNASADLVQAEIARLNPGCQVLLSL